MTGRAVIALVALALAGPVVAQEDLSPERSEARLRACLVTGASAAPRDSLVEAVIYVRSYCAPQIKRLQRHRVDAATAGLSGEDAEAAEDRAIFALNDEIALAISNFTGLTV